MRGVRGIAFVGLTWLAAAGALFALGTSLRDAALLALGLVIQAATGAYWWQQTRRNDGPMALLEAIGMGLVLGPIMALLAGVVAGIVVHWQWWWLLPSVFALADARLRPGRRRILVASARIASLAPALTGILVGFAFLAVNLRRYPLVWDGTWDGYHADMPFFEALGASVARFGPTDSIFMVGEPIRYHWFTYAWQGQLAWAFDTEPFAALTRLLPLVALVALVALTMWWTSTLTRSKAALWVAVALVTTGGYVGAVNGTLLNVDSPSQALTTPWLVALFVVVADVLTRADRQRRVGATALVALLAVALTGGKISAAAVALGALGFTALLGTVVRAEWSRRVWLLLAVVVVAVGTTYFVVLAGAASPGDLRLLSFEARASTIQGLNSSNSARGVVLGTSALAAAIVARWAGLPLLWRDERWRRRPELWLGAGAAVAGLAALALFSQGLNETWFALSVSAPLSVLSAVGLALAWDRAGLRRPQAALAIVGAVVVLPFVAYAWAEIAWEAGLQRFWAPWIGWGGAVVVGLLALLWRPRTAGVVVSVVAAGLIAQASMGRLMPSVADMLGGPRLSPGESTPAVTAASDEPATDSTAGPVTAPSSARAEEVLVLAAVPEPQPRSGWSREEAEAAAWLRANSDERDIVVTNDVLSYAVPALTRLRTYMSGAIYQSIYGATGSVDAIPDRIATSMAFTSVPDDETFQQLCAADARWVWVLRPPATGSDVGMFGHVVFENEDVALVDLDRGLCA